MKCDPEQQFYWCIIKSGEIYLEDTQLPFCKEPELPFLIENQHLMGIWDNKKVIFALPKNREEKENDSSANYDDTPKKVTGFASLRLCLSLPYDLFLLASKARQFENLMTSQKYCSICGAPTQLDSTQIMMKCTDCGKDHYPTISPCVIMAIKKGDQLLMAEHVRHVSSALYTVLAGFVEIGESLEQTVAREVYEETKIKIKNIRYYASQPWPFPSQLMVAFTADYADGEIDIDPNEIADAKWVDKDHLPEHLPPQGTIARELIKSALNLDI